MQGDFGTAAGRLGKARVNPDVEGALLLPVCVLAADTALWRRDFEAALEASRAGEDVLVQGDPIPSSALLAVALRAQADAVEAGVLDRPGAVAEADRLFARLREIVGTEVRLPEPDALLLTGAAERSRLAPEPDPGAWQSACEAWAAISRPYAAAYAGWRWAQALAAARGPRDELERVLRAAHERAVGCDAAHLAEVTEALARRTRAAASGCASRCHRSQRNAATLRASTCSADESRRRRVGTGDDQLPAGELEHKGGLLVATSSTRGSARPTR